MENGYHATSTEEIVAASGVGTRGALYHHFADKRALFEAVFVAVEEDLVAAAAAAARPADAFTELQEALLAFLDATLTPQVQRILLLDGPVVLGWERWRELEAQYGLGAIRSFLEQAVAEGTVGSDLPLDVLAHVLLAAADEAALFVANSPDPASARDDAVRAMLALLSGVRSRTGPMRKR